MDVSIPVLFAFVLSSVFLLFSCATTPELTQSAQSVQPVPVQQIRTAGTTNTDNEPQDLDTTIRIGVDYLSSKLPLNTKVAFVSVQSPTENLSNYIIDTAVMHLVNKDSFTVIERSELGVLEKEQLYQMSGEVSDETAVSIGHQLGVQVIITGAIMETGNRYSLRLKAIDVETARILGTRIYQVEPDQTLTALLKPPPQPTQVTVKEEQTKEPPKQTVIQGDVNITTNNNTTINGDVYVNKPDWFNPDEWF
jgi:TolB-like protein